MDLKYILYKVENGIATITLNRPEQLNAMMHQMGEEMIEAINEADGDDAVRVVVVTGAGRAYCAGADLSSAGSRWDLKSQNVSISEHRDRGGKMALAIYACRKPFIAAINGPAVGFGITMTLPMDIRIAAEDAKIGFVFTRRGVIPEACSTWFLPRIVGISKATELTYTGKIFRAKEEAHSGLFNYVVPKDEVVPKAMEIARDIAENASPIAVTLTKALLWHGLGEDDPQSAHLNDSRCFYAAGAGEDAYEGVESFLQKRPPAFKSKVSTDIPDFYPWWKEPKV
jgi:enoyl-CoA hydratase/carnithine racemase